MSKANRKIRIAYFIQNLETGGAERLLLDLIAHLDAERFDVILIALHRRGELFAHLPAGIRKTYCTANPFRLYAILKRERPDVVHTHLWRGDLLGVPVARLAGVKAVISTRHNVNYFHGWRKILVPWDVLAMHLAHDVVAVSNMVKDFYQTNPLYTNVAFGVIPNGIDVQKFSRCRHKPSGENSAIHLLTVASLKRKKGHLLFLDVLKRLGDVDCVWHLVGDGPERVNIQRKAEQLGLSEKIRFHGVQPDTTSFYEQADVFVLPSLWEGFGLVLVEAMAAGVAVAASDIESIREIIEDGTSGVLFDIHRPDESAEKLRSLLQNSERRESLAACAKQKASYYSIETMVDRYMKLYIEAAL